MLRHLKLLASAGVILCLAMKVQAIDQSIYEKIENGLHDPNAQIRIQAVEQLVRFSPDEAGNNVLPLLVMALSDSDAKVRSYGAAELLGIAIYTNPKVAPLQAGVPDLRSYQPLQNALIVAMDDPNEKTRQQALATYLLSFPIADDLQDKLVEHYSNQGNGKLYQLTIVSALMVDGKPTAKANALISGLMNSSESSIQVAEAIRTSVSPPQALLPQFVNQLESAKEPGRRVVMARAIEKYGSQAKPYMDRINAVKDVEADDTIREELRQIVQSIATTP